MKKKMNFTFYTDPGHGWVKVPLTFLVKLGLEKEISYFSYYRKGYVYLEEDSDLAKFIHKMKEKEIEINFITKNTNRSSKIRSYDSYEYIGNISPK